MDKSVLIMMAVYNGEKYIAEQIDSIIAQSCTNWTLIIQDDGSSDNTAEIVEEYTAGDDRIHYVKNESEVHGAFENFFSLINKCKMMKAYDYYMFADQDDIWHADKIEKLMTFLEEKNLTRPALVYADMATVDQDGQVISESLDAQWGLEKTKRSSFFLSHKVFGCNMMMNRLLFDKVTPLPLTEEHLSIMSHDNYYTKFAAVFGYVYYDPEVLMDYRRHGENSTAGQKYSVDIKRLVRRVTHLSELSRLHANIYNQTLITIREIKKEKLTAKQKAFLDEIEEALLTGGKTAVDYCKKNKILWGNKIENTSRMLILQLGIYKKYLV